MQSEKYICDKNKCTGCLACVDSCPKNAVILKDEMVSLNAMIDVSKCVNCNQCYSVCPNNYLVPQMESIYWYQGWSDSELIRSKSSSGGLAAELARVFVRNGGAVCSCVFQNGRFGFKMVDTEGELEQFRGSKYVKSNPIGAYKETKLRLQNGQSVLFIGLPCQVAAVKNYVGIKLQHELVTIDLICHGTPSSALLKLYMEQHGFDINAIEEIVFRKKNDFMLYINGISVVHPRIQDRYMLSFLKALNYTENCYSCQYSTQKRVSDITIGDSWGSQLLDEVNKGISLVLCQTEKGYNLLKQSRIHLREVDLDEARKNNHQLRHPARLPYQRRMFFKLIKKKVKYDLAVALAYPLICFKQDLKYGLIKILPLESKDDQ